MVYQGQTKVVEKTNGPKDMWSEWVERLTREQSLVVKNKR